MTVIHKRSDDEILRLRASVELASTEVVIVRMFDFFLSKGATHIICHSSRDTSSIQLEANCAVGCQEIIEECSNIGSILCLLRAVADVMFVNYSEDDGSTYQIAYSV